MSSEDPYRSEGRDVAIVIYVPYQNPSNLTVWCLEPLNGEPLLHHLAQRLIAGFAMQSGTRIYLVYPEMAEFDRRIEEALRDLEVEICAYKGSGTLAALRTFCSLHSEAESVLLYPATSLFPDLEMAHEMFASHIAMGADVTFAQCYPDGLLPQIFTTSSVRKLPDLPHLIESEGDALGLMQVIKTLGEQEGTEVCSASVLKWAGPKGQHPLPEDLPGRLLMNDVYIKEAAEQVLIDLGGTVGQNSSGALALKRELVSRSLASWRRGKRRLPRSSPPWKVLFFTLANTFTGGEKIWLDLIANIDRSKFSPLVVLPSRSTLSERLEHAGVPVKVTQFDMSNVTPRTMSFVDDLFDSGAFNLVHVNGIAGLPIVLKAHSANIPLVWHAHSSLIEPLLGPLEFADVVVAVSNAQRREIQRWDIPAERIKVIHNGIDLQAFSPTSYSSSRIRKTMGLHPSSKVICMISRIEESKKIDVMLSALPEILNKYQDTTLFIAGEVFPTCFGYFDRLRDMTSRLGLGQHVRFLNFVEDVRTLYAMADVLVLCREDEPLATCILEALAMGLPVVAPNSWGCPEMITDGQEGVLFDPGNVTGLAKAVLTLFDDATLHSRCSMLARERAKVFDLGMFVRGVQDVFEDAISSGVDTPDLETSRHFGSSQTLSPEHNRSYLTSAR